MLQFGGKGPCGHWDYTFFLELVQACDFFWEEDQNSTEAYLVHSSGA
jgi:hypothetical protein